MLFQHKKAATLSIVAAIIVLLLSAGFIIGLQLDIFETGEKILEGKDCQVALGLQRASATVPFVTYKNACKTIYVEIPEKSRRSIREKEDLSEEFAKKMMRAWDISHKGTIEGMWGEEGFGGFATSGCFILYEIKLDYIPDSFDNYVQKDLYDYLFIENYTKIDGIPKRYLEYVQTAGAWGYVSFPEAYLFGYDESTGIAKFGFKEEPFEENELYAISIASPSRSFFERVSSRLSFSENLNVVAAGTVTGSIFPVIGTSAGFLAGVGSVAINAAWEAFEEIQFPSNKPNNSLMFSTVSYAESVGCIRN